MTEAKPFGSKVPGAAARMRAVKKRANQIAFKGPKRSA